MKKAKLKIRVALCAAIALSPFYPSIAADDTAGGKGKGEEKDKENEQERLSSTSLDIQAGNKHCTS